MTRVLCHQRARVGCGVADEQNRQIRWRHVALVKAPLTSDSEKGCRHGFQSAEELIFKWRFLVFPGSKT